MQKKGAGKMQLCGMRLREMSKWSIAKTTREKARSRVAEFELGAGSWIVIGAKLWPA